MQISGTPRKLTKIILLSLLAGGAGFIILSSPNGTRKLIKAAGYEFKKWQKRQRFLWTLAYLRRRKYIDYREEKDGRIKIVLTEDGKRRALCYKLDEINLPRLKNWDGKWRIVAFDIPEKKKRGRDALREKMQDLGCIQLQKSIWVWPYECRNEIDFIAEVFGVGRYVHYMVVESITSEKFLKYKFNFI